MGSPAHSSGMVVAVWALACQAQAGSLTVLNDWAEAWAEVALAGSGQTWSEHHTGAADASLSVQQSGNLPPPQAGRFEGSAAARVGPAYGDEFPPLLPAVFGVEVLADDLYPGQARAGVLTAWVFRAGGDVVNFDAFAWAEAGHRSGLVLFDLTAGTPLVNSGPITGGAHFGGQLLPGHDYTLNAFALAQFDDGDGAAGLAFGTDALVSFDPDRTHLPTPEPGSAAAVVLALVPFRRTR